MPVPPSVLDDRQEQVALEVDCLFIVRQAWQWDSSFSQPFLEQVIRTSVFCWCCCVFFPAREVVAREDLVIV